MKLKVKLNEYISISVEEERNKLLIFVLEEKIHELDYFYIGELLKRSKNQLEQTNNHDISNKDKKNLKNNYFNKFVNVLKLWSRNKYDTDILLYEISFPLLKKLVKAGDSLAKKVFIHEILKNLWGGNSLVVKYLITEGYDKYVEMDSYRRKVHSPIRFKQIKITLFLCILNIILYIVFMEFKPSIGVYYTFDVAKIKDNHEIRRIVSSVFLHPERFSLFINTCFLLLVGSFFEVNNILSKKVYFVVYIFSGIISNTLYIFVAPLFPEYSTATGASGAIFGLGGAFTIILIVKKKYYLFTECFIFFFFIFVFTLNERINYISHVFGFFIGMISYLVCLYIYQYNIDYKDHNMFYFWYKYDYNIKQR